MANEAQVRCSITIAGPTNQRFSPQPTAFNADVSKDGGPTPGQILAATAGTSVDLSQLTSPGFARIMNLGVDSGGNALTAANGNYVEVGVLDPDTNAFYPLLELLPGESYIVRLSRFLSQQFGGTAVGTGTVGSDTGRLRVKAIGTACKVLVEAMER